MEKLDPKTPPSWDELIEKKIVIKDFADLLDVSQDYLIYQTDFLRGVTLNNKYLAINAINKTIDRINEVNANAQYL